MTDRELEPFERALGAVAKLLAALPGPGMIIGGVAVIAHGHVRATSDIDVTVSGEHSLDQVVSLASTCDILPRIGNAIDFARRTQVLLLRHQPTGTEVDLSLAWLPFEQDALARPMVVHVRGLTLHVCHPEDLIVYKMVAARPVDLEDARQLMMRHRVHIDRLRVRRILAEFDSVLEDGRSRVDLWQAIEQSADPRS